ncbi:hypothetical protein [Nocardiopsis tropica]|uniref:Uncharacterized protein n=1 Tax=Nocardiopsis tropica TaxID=109330 RepID=A0ABV1ZNC0_9ACTN
MIVEVDSDIFAEHANAADVIRLFDLFIRGVHAWAPDISQIEDVDSFFGTHVPMMRQTYRSLAEKAVSASPWQPANTAPAVRVTVETLTDHVHDLSVPAVLLVENNASDKSFLQAIAMVLDGDDILTAIGERTLDIRNGGGKDDAGRQAHEAVDEFRRLPRVALLLDSDRMRPGEMTKCHQIAERAREQGVVTHVLEFRETENYVPNRVLALAVRRGGATAASRKLTALKELSPDQRAHFDMKHGFRAQRGAPVVPHRAHGDLYDGVPARTLVKLSEGFGSDLTKRMEAAATQGHVRRSDLSSLGEGVVEELRGVLHMLRTIV